MKAFVVIFAVYVSRSNMIPNAVPESIKILDLSRRAAPVLYSFSRA